MPTPVVAGQQRGEEAGLNASPAKGESSKRRLRSKPWTPLEDKLLARLAAATEEDWCAPNSRMSCVWQRLCLCHHGLLMHTFRMSAPNLVFLSVDRIVA